MELSIPTKYELFLKISISLIDGLFVITATPSLSGPESNGNEARKICEVYTECAVNKRTYQNRLKKFDADDVQQCIAVRVECRQFFP